VPASGSTNRKRHGCPERARLFRIQRTEPGALLGLWRSSESQGLESGSACLSVTDLCINGFANFRRQFAAPSCATPDALLLIFVDLLQLQFGSSPDHIVAVATKTNVRAPPAIRNYLSGNLG